MSVPTTPCCINVLKQQEETIEYHNQCSDAAITPCNNTTGMRTTVENGRVVVKPIAPLSVEPEP